MKILFENNMYAAVAEPGTVIDFGGGYCHKLYRKRSDFSDCAEVDAAAVLPEEEEAYEDLS